MFNREIKFFDSHIHLNSDKLSSWFEKNYFKYQNWIFNNVSTNLNDLEVAVKQSYIHKNVFVTVGIHPLDIKNLDIKEVFARLNEIVQHHPRVIGIGETGLDFYAAKKEDCFNLQKKWLLWHIELARKYYLPLVLHIRDAHDLALKIFSRHKDVYGVIHCFDGDIDTANKYLNLGRRWMISISPIIFRSNNQTKEIIRDIDINRLLVETDAPYLSENHQKVTEIIDFIAQEKGISPERCRTILLSNFLAFFSIRI